MQTKNHNTLDFQQLKNKAQAILPMKTSPLVQCITNEITCESMANALLFVDAKPVMADDAREFYQFFQQNDALLLNLGHISEKRVANIIEAAKWAQTTNKPVVIDLVGVAASQLRLDLAIELLQFQPSIIKGNISEMRAFCKLASHGKGVDGSSMDQTNEALLELKRELENKTRIYPNTAFFATGELDMIVSNVQTIFLSNGVPLLDRFTGTGDIVGALAAAFLGIGITPLISAFTAISYFNICGETAFATLKNSKGIADFRQATLNQLSLLMENNNWTEGIRGNIQ